MILDDNVGGNLQCDHNTPGVLTITTPNVGSNRRISVQIFANNSRSFTSVDDIISEYAFIWLYQMYQGLQFKIICIIFVNINSLVDFL